MTPVGPATAQKRVPASREDVWAVLEQTYLRHAWWPETAIDFVIGGSVSERTASGEVDVLMRGHAVGFRWQDATDERATEVLITLRSYDAETGILVSETGFGRFSDAAERAAAAQDKWAALLEELARVVADPPAAHVAVAPVASETTDEAEVAEVAEVTEVAAEEAFVEEPSDAEHEGIELPEPIELPAPVELSEPVELPEPEVAEEADESDEPETPDEAAESDEAEESEEPEHLDFDEFIRGAFGDDALK